MPRKSSTRIFALSLALLVLAPASGFPQTVGTPSDVVSQVIGLAPQLVVFAGSDANFRALVTGLNEGTPVTLVTVTPDGLTQTVTFTPTGTMSATDIARTLENARQQLISRGVAAPSALQIGTTLVGGTLTTAAGSVQVDPLLTQTGAVAANASTGASAPRVGGTSSTSSTKLTVTTQPTTTTTGTTSVTTGAAGSSSTANTGTSAAPGVVLSGPNPIFTTTPAPAITSPNGNPSPAVQMQGHR
jgi:hypothetical protein